MNSHSHFSYLKPAVLKTANKKTLEYWHCYTIAYLTFKAIHPLSPQPYKPSSTITNPSLSRQKSSHTFIYTHCFMWRRFQSLIPSHSEYPSLFLSRQSLPSPLSNLLSKPTISNCSMVPKIVSQWVTSLFGLVFRWVFRSVQRLIWPLSFGLSPKFGLAKRKLVLK